MKKTKYFLLFTMLAMLWLLLTPACIKSPMGGDDPPKVNEWDTLPAITQHGANTMGCLLNDTVWVSHGITLMGSIKSAWVYEKNGSGSGSMLFRIAGKGDYDQDFSFAFDSTFLRPKKFYFALNSLGNYAAEARFSQLGKSYLPNYAKPNPSDFFEITHIDSSKNIVSGLFGFTMYKRIGGTDNVDTTDSIVIKDGRFDMIYLQQ